MRTKDFEKAVEAVGAEILQMRYNAKTGGQVLSCIGKIGELTYIMWDEGGRAFVFNQDPDGEDCVSEFNMMALPYERDKNFDLKF